MLEIRCIRTDCRALASGEHVDNSVPSVPVLLVFCLADTQLPWRQAGESEVHRRIEWGRRVFSQVALLLRNPCARDSSFAKMLSEQVGTWHFSSDKIFLGENGLHYSFLVAFLQSLASLSFVSGSALPITSPLIASARRPVTIRGRS